MNNNQILPVNWRSTGSAPIPDSIVNGHYIASSGVVCKTVGEAKQVSPEDN